MGMIMLVSIGANLATPLRTDAAVSSNINFQAKLESSDGAIAPDGNYNLEFKLYKSLAAGASAAGVCVGGATDDCLWKETYLNSATQGVRVVNGYLTANLGSITAFPASIAWDQSLYITMNIGGTGAGAPTYDGEMSPRLQLTAVPYAFQAKSASQLQVSNGANVATLSFTTPTATNNILLPNASGTVCLATTVACGFAASTGSAAYIQNGTGLQANANFNIVSAATTSITASIQALTGQTADLLRFENSAGTAALSGFNSGGQLYYQSGSFTGTLIQDVLGQTTAYHLPDPGAASDTFCLLTKANCVGTGGAVSTTAGTQNYITKYNNAGATQITKSQLFDNGTNIGLNTIAGFGTVARFTLNNNVTADNATSAQINSGAAANKGLVVQGFGTSTTPNQTADLLQVQSSTGAVLAKIDNVGNLTAATVNGLSQSSTSLDTTVAGALSIGPTNATLTIGNTAKLLTLQGSSSSIITATSGANTTTVNFQSPIANVSYSFPATTVGSYNICTSAGNCLGGGGGGANTALSNLNSVAINASLLPGVNNSIDVGSSTLAFRSGYFATSLQAPLLQTANTATASTNSAGLALTTGNATGTTSNSGAITLDSGTATGTAGTLSLGASNASAITLGRTGVTTLNPGVLTVSQTLNANATGKTAISIADSGAQNSGLTIGGDTTLYRSATSTLKTDGSLVVGTLGATGTTALCSNAGLVATCAAGSGSGNYIVNGIALQTTANFNIQSAAAGSVGGIIRGATSQTADLLQLQNSAGTVLTHIDLGGNLAIGTASTPAAALQVAGSIQVDGLSALAQPTVTNIGTAGSTSYTYTVTATLPGGETSAATVRITNTANATLDGTNFNRISWATISGAKGYYIYRTASSGTPASVGRIGTVTAATSSFDDTGIAANTSNLTPGTNNSSAALSSNNILSLHGATSNSNANFVNIGVANNGVLGSVYSTYAFSPSVTGGAILHQFDYNSLGSGPATSDTVYLASFTTTGSLNGPSTPILQLSTSGKLLFGSASDTNLYRSLASTLKTDGSLRVGTINTGGTNLLCYDANNQLATCSSAPGAGSYITNSTSLQTNANFNIQAVNSGVNGTIGGIIRGAAGGQTVDLLQFQDASTGAILTKVDASGNIRSSSGNNFFGYPIGTVIGGSTVAISSTAINAGALIVSGVAGQTANVLQVIGNATNGNRALVITAGNRVAIGANNTTPGATAHIQANATSEIGTIIQGQLGQTADLLQIQNSSNTVLNRVDASGNLSLGTMASPTISSVVAGGAGSLATNTYYYKISAIAPDGGETLPSAESSVAVTGPTGSVTITYGPVQGASSYRVYRGTSSGGENVYYTTTAISGPYIFVDTGAANTGGSPTATSTAYNTKLVVASGGTSFFATTLTSPGTGSNSEHFGLGSTATGSGSTAIGQAANAAQEAVALGGSSVASGITAIALGVGSTASGNNSIALGRSANTGGFSDSIALGRGATNTTNNQLVVQGISSAYFGNGVTNAAPTSFTLQGTGSSTAGTAGAPVTFLGGAGTTTGAGSTGGAITLQAGTAGGLNIGGAATTIAGGQGTGTAVGGNIVFQYAPAGASSSTANSLQAACTISGSSGNLSCGNGITLTTGNTFTNASSTLNSAIALGNLDYSASGNSGAIGTAAATVNVATAFTINQTTAGQTLTIPSPTNVAAGRVIYISNIGSASFTMLGATISIGTSATIIWSGSAWTFAGADGSSILNQNATNQTANFRITGTGQINTSVLTPLVDGISVALGGTAALGVGTSATGTTALTVGNTSSTFTAESNATTNLFNGNTAHTINLGAGATGTNAITLGSTNSTSTTLIQGGSGTATGDIVLQTAASGIINIGTNAVTGKILNLGSVGSTANASIIRIADTTGAANQSVTIANGITAAGNTAVVTIGSNNANTGSVTTIQGGSSTTGAILLTPNAAGAIAIGAASGTGNITVGSSSASQTVIIGGGTGLSTVQIANDGTSGNTVTIAGGATANTKTDTINIGTGTAVLSGSKVIHIGDGGFGATGTSSVTIGATANGSATTLQAGSGNINLNAATIATNATTLALFNTNAATVTALQAATSISLGATTGTLTVRNANQTFGNAAGSGLFTNNGATLNSTLAVLNDSDGGALGGTPASPLTAAQSVDVYTSISIAQTTAGQTIALPNPTANTVYGRVLYISNIGLVSFTLLGTTFNPGATGTLIWSNTNGGATWQFAGADGNGILNQISTNQTADFRISGTGRANTSFISPIVDGISVALGGAATLGVGTSTTGTTALTVGNTSSTFTAESNATANLFNGNTAHTINLGTGTASNGITIGSAGSTSNTIIQGGTGTATGDIVLQTAASGIVNIGTNNVASKVINIGSVAAVAQDTDVHIADSSGGVQTLTLGSVNSTSSTTIRGGTGAINLNAATIATNATTLALFNTNAVTVTALQAATSISLGATTGTLTVRNANQTFGNAAGSGLFTNNGATLNSTLAVLNDSDGGALGGTPASPLTAAQSVDVYTSISIAQTTAGQTIALPNPTANTVYGRVLYISNIGLVSFTLLGTTFNPGATGTLIWSNTNGGATWQFAGADGNGILNQISTNQTADFRISGTGRANTSFISPIVDGISVALGGAATLGVGTSTTGTTALTVGNTSSTFTAESNATANLFNGNTAHTINLGTGTASNGITIGSTNATSSLILQAGASSNVTINASLLQFSNGGNRVINIAAQGAANTAGNNLSIQSAAGNGTGLGGDLSFQAGTGGATNANGGNLFLAGGAKGGTGADGSVIVRPTNNSSNTFQIQSAAGASTLLIADTTTGVIRIGSTATSSITPALAVTTLEVNTRLLVGNTTDGVDVNTGAGTNAFFRLKGNARNIRTVALAPEFAGMVLHADTTNNIGSLTSDVDTANNHTYYNWTTAQTTAQDYDMYVHVPVPRDFGAFTSTGNANVSICYNVWSDDASPAAITGQVNDTSNVSAGSSVITPTAVSTWQSKCGTYTFTTVTVNGTTYLTFDIHVAANQNKNFRIGEVTFDYLSQY